MSKLTNIRIPTSWRDKSIFQQENAPFNAAWVINAKWAHPLWDQYVLLLYDLTTPYQDREVIKKDPRATHEFILYAIDRATPISPDKTIAETKVTYLQPANYGYQFIAESDDAAVDRMCKIIDMIGSMRLSPDTDWRKAWDDLFKDGFTLHSSAFENVNLSGVTH